MSENDVARALVQLVELEPFLASVPDCFPFLGVWSVFFVRLARASLQRTPISPVPRI